MDEWLSGLIHIDQTLSSRIRLVIANLNHGWLGPIANAFRLDGIDYPIPSGVEVFRMALARAEQIYYPRREQVSQECHPSGYAANRTRAAYGGGRLPDEAYFASDARHRIIHTSLTYKTIPIDITGLPLRPCARKQYRRTLEPPLIQRARALQTSGIHKSETAITRKTSAFVR